MVITDNKLTEEEADKAKVFFLFRDFYVKQFSQTTNVWHCTVVEFNFILDAFYIRKIGRERKKNMMEWKECKDVCLVR